MPYLPWRREIEEIVEQAQTQEGEQVEHILPQLQYVLSRAVATVKRRLNEPHLPRGQQDYDLVQWGYRRGNPSSIEPKPEEVSPSLGAASASSSSADTKPGLDAREGVLASGCFGRGARQAIEDQSEPQLDRDTEQEESESEGQADRSGRWRQFLLRVWIPERTGRPIRIR